MKILFVTTEMCPYVRTKELADFSYNLTKHLNYQDVEVRVVMPKYKMLDIKNLQTVCDFGVDMANRQETCVIKRSSLGKVVVYFVENYQYFGRDFMYAYDDDCERFAFFSKAALKMIKKLNFCPDVIHINDWNTAPISMMIKESLKNDKFYENIAVVYTIHDLVCQGICQKGFLKLMGVDESVFSVDKAEYYNMLNYAKIGINYSDVVTTVSRSYAEEIKTRAYGNGLDGVLRARGGVVGILNGIDYKEYNPKTDVILHRNYGHTDSAMKLSNKYFLQDKLCLPKKDVPMIAFVAPLIEDKGVEIMLSAMDDILKNDVQLVVVGIGNAAYENSIKFAVSKYRYQMFALIGEDDDLVRQIFAASDIYLAPYRLLPCGKNEIIALRYGVIPVVRSVGSLNDVVIDIETDGERGYGYKFDKFTKIDMLNALGKAINCYYDNNKWRGMVERAMKMNFSWSKTSGSYKKIYLRSKMTLSS